MSNKILFLITVNTEKDFDRHPGTRRILTDRTFAWHESFGINELVREIWCGSDYPALQLFTRAFEVHGRDMKIVHDLSGAEINSNPRVALGQILDRGHCDLVITSTLISKAFESVFCPCLPPFEHSQLYIIVTDGTAFRVISTEDRKAKPPTMMTSEDFRKTLEEAGERTASRT